MNKTELLKMLSDEYKQSVRLPNDISLKDYRDTIERETGVKISYTRAMKVLNSLDQFTSLLVVDRGKVIRVWRESNEQTRNTYQSKSKRDRRVSKKNRRSAIASSVSV